MSCKKEQCDFFNGIDGCDRPEEFKICKDVELAVSEVVSKDVDSDVDED